MTTCKYCQAIFDGKENEHLKDCDGFQKHMKIGKYAEENPERKSGELIIPITIKKTDEREYHVKWVRYDDKGAELYQLVPKGANITKIYDGKLEVNSKIKFKHMDNDEIRWGITFKGNKFVGGIEEITEFIIQHGNVFIGKDEMKKVMAQIITTLQSNTPSLSVRPAVGIYYDFREKKVDVACDDKTVYPELDSQKTVFRSYNMERSRLDKEKTKEVLQATIDLIDSMPAINKQPALVVRGFSCIAPIAYEIKKTTIGVFPYLYLYGQKGSSKTQLALYSCSKCFGEGNLLNSDSVDSQFRLGMEFAATKYPRVIDEAKDIFEKHQSIFKAAATGELATKRGNKDKTMSSYPAFCAFVLTSNLMPINNEEDAQGAINDRVVIIECERGADFNKEKYQSAIRVLNENGMLFGEVVVEKLKKILEEKGMVYFMDEINRLSGLIQEMVDVPLRRAHCLSILIIGIKLYAEILTEAGMKEPVEFTDERTMINLIVGKLAEKTIEDEKQFAKDFYEWALAMYHTPQAALSGLYRSAGDGMIVTKNALKTYKKYFQIKNMAINDLPALCLELKKIGIKTEVKNNKDNSNNSKWGILLPLTNEIAIVRNENPNS